MIAKVSIKYQKETKNIHSQSLLLFRRLNMYIPVGKYIIMS
jgi:hypothetical protein